jgi:hypothetical protein
MKILTDGPEIHLVLTKKECVKLIHELVEQLADYVPENRSGIISTIYATSTNGKCHNPIRYTISLEALK